MDLVAGFGSAWMRDLSFGLEVVRELRPRAQQDSILLADWSFGTVTAFQKLCEQEFRRAVFVGSSTRGLEPGRLHVRRPSAELPSGAEIHQRICDCVMGLVSLDNLLIMAQYYGKVPREVLVLEAEAVDDTWGDTLSPGVAALVEPAAATAWEFLTVGSIATPT